MINTYIKKKISKQIYTSNRLKKKPKISLKKETMNDQKSIRALKKWNK
jgi:hypothetical protein